MTNSSLIVFISICSYSVLCSITNKTLNLSDDITKYSDGRIVGGSSAYLGQFPYQVSLRMANINHHFCGGCLVSNRWIVTAAHCIDETPMGNVQIVVGTLSLNSYGTIYYVSQVIQHNNWNSYLRSSDIGLVQSTTKIHFTAYVYPIKLGSSYVSTINAILSGWGHIYENGPLAQALGYLSVETITNENCRQRYAGTKHENAIYDHTLCTYQPVGKGFCSGDSGGPLVANGVLIGIVSWVPNCGSGQPDTYVRLSSFYNWIISYTG